MVKPAKLNAPFARCESSADVGYGNGWCAQLNRAYSNGWYVVMMRDFETEWGAVTHMFIRNLPNTDIPWAEKQRLKNLFLGVESEAIEFFPKASQLVDEAGAYHLWHIHNKVLPFGLHETQGLER